MKQTRQYGRYYTKKPDGKYVVSRNIKGESVFYGQFDNEEDAKRVVEFLRGNGWKKDDELIRLKKEIKNTSAICEEDYELLLKFQRERNLCDSTFKGMYSTLKKYTNFHKMSFVELLDEALEEQDSNIPLRKSKLKRRLLDYRDYLLNDVEMSPTTIKTYFSKIKTFYTHFEVELPILPMTQYPTQYVTTYNDIPTTDHIKQALSMVHDDVRAVILFQSSSGSAKAEALSLKVEQLFKGVEEYTDVPLREDKDTLLEFLGDINRQLDEKKIIVPTFYLKRAKTKKWYYTYCTPEATQAIIRALIPRVRVSESIEKLLKEPLFDFTSSLLLTRFQEINDYFGWGFKGKYRLFRSHTLRKFNASNIGMVTEDIDAIQGRSKNTVHEAYIKVKPGELKKRYMQHMWRVCIDDQWKETCILLDPIAKNELGIRSPEERAFDKLTMMLEEKFGGANPLAPQAPVNDSSQIQQSQVSMGTGDFDKLLEFGNLYNQGLISLEEFNQIKRQTFGSV